MDKNRASMRDLMGQATGVGYSMRTNNGEVYASYEDNIDTTYTLAEPCTSIFLINDGVAGDIVITINGLSFTIKTSEGINEAFEPFNEVILTNASTEPYRMWVRK